MSRRPKTRIRAWELGVLCVSVPLFIVGVVDAAAMRDVIGVTPAFHYLLGAGVLGIAIVWLSIYWRSQRNRGYPDWHFSPPDRD